MKDLQLSTYLKQNMQILNFGESFFYNLVKKWYYLPKCFSFVNDHVVSSV